MGCMGSKTASPPEAPAVEPSAAAAARTPSAVASAAHANQQQQLNLLTPLRGAAQSAVDYHTARAAQLKQVYDKARDDFARDDFAPSSEVLKAKRAYEAEIVDLQNAEAKLSRLSDGISRIVRMGEVIDEVATNIKVMKLDKEIEYAILRLEEAAKEAKEHLRKAQEETRRSQAAANSAREGESTARQGEADADPTMEGPRQGGAARGAEVRA